MPKYIFSDGKVYMTDSKGVVIPNKNKEPLQSGILIFAASIIKNISQPDLSTKGKPENDNLKESHE